MTLLSRAHRSRPPLFFSRPYRLPEIFGPVCCITPFTTLPSVLARANASPYGLAAAVFTENLRTAHTCVRKLNAGMVFVNSSGDASLQLPFGGNKVSP
jgi:aldehyde dehydrogenase (NAD+)